MPADKTELITTGRMVSRTYIEDPVPPEKHLYRLLYQVIDNADRLSVEHQTLSRTSRRYLYQSADRKDFDALKNSLVIRRARPQSYNPLQIGSPAICFFKGDEYIGHLTNHEGISVSFSLWNGPVVIKDRKKWRSWFHERDILSGEEAEKWGTTRWEINRDQGSNPLNKFWRWIVRTLFS